MRRTNIYLEEQTLQVLKKLAKREGVTVAAKIRQVLKRDMQKTEGDWAESLLSLSKKASGSGLGDLAKNHDKYLLGMK